VTTGAALLGILPLGAAFLAGCAATTPAAELREVDGAMPVPAERRVCGWEALGDRASHAPVVAIAADGDSTGAVPGPYAVIVQAHDAARFADVLRALAPMKDSLVRLKVPIDGRWLLPMTYPYRRPAERPPPEKAVVRIVGKRRVTRWSDAPAERFAALELDRGTVSFDVENEGRARRAPIAKLRGMLAQSQPPVGVVALHVSDDTPWAQVVEVLLITACHDRKPGQEPHEVIVD
jgi:hypothetical protein